MIKGINCNSVHFFLRMDKYNLYTNKSYEKNIEIIREKTSKSKNIIQKFKDKIAHNSYIRNKLTMINRICKETAIRDIILNNYSTRQLLQIYLMINHPNIKPDIYHLLRCYDLCVLILRIPKNIIKYDTMMELFENCPSFFWENKIKQIYNNGKLVEHYQTILCDLKNLCSFDILRNIEYKKFLKELNNESEAIKTILMLMHKQEKRLVKATKRR